MHTDNNALRHAGTALAIALGVMFPVGIAGMALGMFTGALQWTTSLFLGLQAALTFVLLVSASSIRRAVAISTAIGAAATLVEFIGLATGFPFGTYYYSYTFEPFIVSNVPLAIVFAWYILVVNIVLAARTRAAGLRGTAATALAGGLFIMGIDIMLEPFASFVNRYWTWSGGTVPLQNYAAWFAIGAALIALTHSLLPRTSETRGEFRPAGLPVFLLGMTAAQCVIINVLNGYWIPTAAGLSIAGAAYWSIRHGKL